MNKPDQPPKPFKSDGCTLSADMNFRHCCEAHDKLYWQGGTSVQRKQADLEFCDCIRKSGHPVFAWFYYLGVRAGGTPLLPTPWRWGFGWPWGRVPKGEAENSGD